MTEKHGDPRFHKLLEEIGDLHSRKSHDYGSGEDPLANVRASQEFNLPTWLGVLCRINDKMIRLKAFCSKGNLKFEGVEDSLLDISVYCLMAVILFREDQVKGRIKYWARVAEALRKYFKEQEP